MMFEEVRVPRFLWRLNSIYVTFTSYLPEMDAKKCFALRVKRPSSLPTVHNQTVIV